MGRKEGYEAQVVGGVDVLRLVGLFVDGHRLLHVLARRVFQTHLGVAHLAGNVSLLRSHVVPQHRLLHEVVAQLRITIHHSHWQVIQIGLHLLLPVALHVQVADGELRQEISLIGSLDEAQNSELLRVLVLNESTFQRQLRLYCSPNSRSAAKFFFFASSWMIFSFAASLYVHASIRFLMSAAELAVSENRRLCVENALRRV